MSDLLGMLGYGLLAPEASRLNEKTGGLLGGQAFQPGPMGLSTTGGGGSYAPLNYAPFSQNTIPTGASTASAGPGAIAPGMGGSLGASMGSAHEAAAPLGFSGYLGGGANVMPSMGGFGPMAQMWGGVGALDSLFRKDVQGDVSTGESMLGNAAQGALAGSYFGWPWGTVIGAGIGALGGSK